MIGAGLAIVLVAGLGLLLFLTTVNVSTKQKVQKSNLNLALVRTRWQDITEQAKNQLHLKEALIEADKLLDYILKGQGYNGETMAQRIKAAEKSFTDKESVWRAHKLRNHMVHEFADVVPQQVEHAIKDLGQAIRDLGVQL